MPEKVPLWVVENTFGTFGSRFPKRAETLPNDYKECATCQVALYKIADWNYCKEKYYCNNHIQAARDEASRVWKAEADLRREEWREADRRRGFPSLAGFTPTRVITEVPRTEAEVPAGNLDEYLYQYWVGCIDESIPRNIMTTRSTCRACGAVVHGVMGRAIHKQESVKLYSGLNSCMKVLSTAIRNLVHLHNCMVCKAFTTKKHYGVPICSPNCHKIWRFNDKLVYQVLDMEVAKFWTTDTAETGGSIISESSSNLTPIALYQEEQE